ncbi:response regulator [Paenibacillus sp. NPDC058071]|uniref:response regulator n=1 Tax=Paenibacillus sp. NPDC058071 TaxID=3346326 RepID=UPI0036DDE480
MTEGLNVLVVDDNAFMRRVLRGILEPMGHVVIEAGDGMEAIMFHQAWRPDLILMDIAMPILDGLSAAAQIRAADPAVKLIMCSEAGQGELILRALRNGANEFIVKPYHANRIATIIDELLPCHPQQQKG